MTDRLLAPRIGFVMPGDRLMPDRWVPQLQVPPAGGRPAPSPPSPVVAPPPAAAPLPMATEPALFIVEEFQLYTVNGDVGFLLPQVDVITVLGNETKTTHVRKTVTESFERSFSHSALEAASEASSKAFSEDMRSASNSAGSTDTFDYRLDSTVHMEGELGLNSVEGNARLNAKTSSTAVHNEVAEAAEHAVAKHALSTKSATSEQRVAVTNNVAGMTSEERAETVTIDNSNNAAAINYAICRLGIEKVTALCLTDVKLAVYDARSHRTNVVKLAEMDSMLEQVIADDGKRAQLRDKLLAWLLRPVFDCNSDPRKMVEMRSLENTDFPAMPADLITTISMPRSDGEARAIQVPGIAISKKYQILPTNSFGAAVLAP
jgi:hypothetical protein